MALPGGEQRVCRTWSSYKSVVRVEGRRGLGLCVRRRNIRLRWHLWRSLFYRLGDVAFGDLSKVCSDWAHSSVTEAAPKDVAPKAALLSELLVKLLSPGSLIAWTQTPEVLKVAQVVCRFSGQETLAQSGPGPTRFTFSLQPMRVWSSQHIDGQGSLVRATVMPDGEPVEISMAAGPHSSTHSGSGRPRCLMSRIVSA